MTLVPPGLLFLALLVPVLMAGALWLWVRRRRRVGVALGERRLVGRIAGADLHALPRTRGALLLVAAIALGVAAADPRWGAAAERAEGRALDLLFVLDVSNSMLAQDVEPSRLERQRDAARGLTRSLRGDRLGVVVFAGRAYILAPPTLDHGAVELYLDALSPEMVLQTGSSLAAALRQGTNLLAGRDGADAGGVLVLISDGEALEEQEAVLAAARRAAAAGVTVYTVGIGTPQGAPVPDLDPDTGEQVGFKTDPATGQVALSRLDPTLLREIASATGGAYHHLEERGVLDRLLAQLEREERRGGGAGARRDRAPRYGWFVGLALLCLAADALRERASGQRRG